MMMSDRETSPDTGISRREFLGRTAAIGAGLATGGVLAASARRLLAQATTDTKADRPRSRVIVVTHPEVLVRKYEANAPVLNRIVERAVRELTGAATEKKAWQTIATTGDRVSMKTTRAAGKNLKTHDEIAAYLSKRLVELAGVDKDKVRAWDRGDLKGADLELSDPYTLPTRKKATHLRAALVKDTTAIINLPVLKSHSGTGASVALKNHFGSINNPSAFHGWTRGDMPLSIAELNALDPIKSRTRLVVVDATRPLYNGGPHDKPEYRWNFNGIIVGTDPVAVEAVGLQILEKKREEAKGAPWPLTDAHKVIAHATKLNLGTADLKRIDLVRIDLD